MTIEQLTKFFLTFLTFSGLGGLTCATGCSEEASKQWTDTVGKTATSLEESGADWRMEAYLPAIFEGNWNPFGFRTGFPGGYARFYAGTGRPRGLRPVDVVNDLNATIDRVETDPDGEMVDTSQGAE